MRYITTAEVADVVLRRYDGGDIADGDLIADPMSPVTWKIRYKGVDEDIVRLRKHKQIVERKKPSKRVRGLTIGTEECIYQ